MIDESVLCVHGGLSPDIKTIDHIRTIERNQEIPHKGAFCGKLGISIYVKQEDFFSKQIAPSYVRVLLILANFEFEV